VLYGAAEMVQPELSGEFARIMQWADNVRRLRVRTNAETPEDVRVALEFGAEGIGLCRTEHMFFDASRIAAVREMILAQGPEERVAALSRILPFQRDDFAAIFRLLEGKPATIRLLDPPLHEFLPHSEEDCVMVASALGLEPKALIARVKELTEVNPMLGFRGCRLAIAYPEIYAMQTRAIFEAAVAVHRETGVLPMPEVMIPFVIGRKELAVVKRIVEGAAEQVLAAHAASIPYLIGTMIELPRAALRAAEIAEEASFFSFGTNDLTQTTLGVSRDDAARFLGLYVDQGLLERDPFVSIDASGVGELVEIAVERGRSTRPDLKLGICGEHGGDPDSIALCEKIGLDYVSCSPYRVPIARLSAAQAALKGTKSTTA
jgi:pyruvate,orthophosphate dikinase